ncbi:MAG: sulfur oxidation c-type cytochrome SoxX [Sphingomonadales bacterium]
MRAAAAALLLGLAAFAGGCGEDRLVEPSQIVGDAIPASLTGAPGDPDRGRAIFTAREGGHCVLCHAVAGLDAEFQGNVGPELSDVGARLTPGQIRLRIVDASLLNPDTVMPAYYRIHGLNQVSHGLDGKPVLSSGQIEDLVAYLAALNG